MAQLDNKTLNMTQKKNDFTNMCLRTQNNKSILNCKVLQFFSTQKSIEIFLRNSVYY